MKKILLNPWTAVFTLCLLVALRLWDPSFVESVRLRYFDQLITSQPAQDVPIHVVNIDEDSLDKYGQWPFPRGMYADIIKDLYARDAGLVVFNVLMPERDRFKEDKILARQLEETGVVLPMLGNVKGKNSSPDSKAQTVGFDSKGKLVEYPAVIVSVPDVAEKAIGMGIVNTFPEVDGVVRRMPLAVMADNSIQPALALEIVRVAVGDPKFQIKFNEHGVEALRVPKVGKIDTDNISRIWIDWSASPKEHSLVNLPTSFNGGIVVVGLSAAGLVNPVSTARGEVWPQYLQAAVVGTISTQSVIQRPSWAEGAEVLAIAAIGLLIIFMSRWVYAGIGFFVLLALCAMGGSYYSYVNYKWLVDSTLPVLSILLVALHAYSVKFISEFLQKQQIKKQFQSYLSPDLVAKLIKDPSLLKLGGEEKELSIMFTDVRGFTSISEHYGKDVQGLTSIMNRYMTAMTKCILENNGTLDKYIGDAQMAFWNAPLDETIHCKESVKAALEMLGNLKEFNDEITKEGIPAFGMGIGINTGVVVVGNMGSEQRFDYTCLGDAVNLASRLEGQSKNYGVLIVIGPVTAERLDGMFFELELDCIAVKGKKEGVNIFTVFYNPEDSEISRWNQDREAHNKMLAAYRAQDWKQAIDLVNSLKGAFNGQMDHYYELWLERIADMKAAKLPKDWDGVYRATSK
ncbi:MAG: adenylate/guanylate cyclase domain-containing protein [Proteobacteria bacterium]|nr:adenylate/guanylate cyclase domain-containing protein [Pseudomonadota bacterium]